MATIDQALNSAPLWITGTAFFLLLSLAFWAGTLLRPTAEGTAPEASTADGHLLSAVLALLGLLIAFTFSLALSRYDSRRSMVVEEGNAISTAWLRATLADGAEGEAYRAAIRTYTDIRIKLPDSGNRAQVEAASMAAQNAVWAGLKTALPHVDGPIGATMVNATTEMFDAAERRKAERSARIPGRVLDVVSLYALVAAGIIGHVLGRHAGLRQRAMSLVLFLLLALAMVLILDLDRPWSGGISISQQPILDARAAMR